MGGSIVSTLLQVISQVSVLAQVLGAQRDGVLLAILSFAASMSDWVTRWNVLGTEQGGSRVYTGNVDADIVQSGPLRRRTRTMYRWSV